MRRALYWAGWIILFLLPVLFAIEIVRIQNLPPVQLWQWGILGAAVLLVFFFRNRDDVFKHHVV